MVEHIISKQLKQVLMIVYCTGHSQPGLHSVCARPISGEPETGVGTPESTSQHSKRKGPSRPLRFPTVEVSSEETRRLTDFITISIMDVDLGLSTVQEFEARLLELQHASVSIPTQQSDTKHPHRRHYSQLSTNFETP